MIRYNRSSGFSLIEMLVAMVILALTLGVLYQASAGAARNVRLDERYTYAVQIAQSLLADHARLPPGGLQLSGTTGDDYRWELTGIPLDVDPALPEATLYRLDVVVRWEGDGDREVALTTVVPELVDIQQMSQPQPQSPGEALND